MKVIAFVMPWHISERGGGAEVQANFLAQELGLRGYDVSYVCQTITGSDVDGGGVYVSSSSTAIIDRCIFQGNKIPNTSNSDGSAIANVGGIATIQNCLFYDNNCQTTTSNGHIYTTGKVSVLRVKSYSTI